VGPGDSEEEVMGSNTQREPSQGWGVTTWARLLAKQDSVPRMHLAASPMSASLPRLLSMVHDQTEQRPCSFPALGWVWVIHSLV